MIICLGTTPTIQRVLFFEKFSMDRVNRAKRVGQCGSGKSVNAARVLRTLGHSPRALGFLGGDSGKYIGSELSREGIDHDFIDVKPPTRTCTTVIDAATDTVTELVENSAAVDEFSYDKLFEKFELLLGKAKAVVLSGSLTPGGPVNFYARCVQSAAAKNVPIVLDAQGLPLMAALAMKPTVVKPNRVELEETVAVKIDSDDSLKSAITKLIAAGPQWAVVTHGANATVCSDGKSFWKISSPKISAVNPIGSGDSFAGGLAAGIASGQTVPEACKLAVACGAANALTDLPGHISVTDVDRLSKEIVVERFD